MLVLAAIAPLLAVLSVLASACDRWGPPDPAYPAADRGVDPPASACAA
jgi:hypothetical protein